MTFPVIRILTSEQPVNVPSAEQFMLFWGPYFFLGMVTVAIAGSNGYSYNAFALMSASFWIHVLATILTVFRRKGSFAVTPKQGTATRQIRPVVVPMVVCAILLGVAIYGLMTSQSPAMITNVSFATVHVLVLASGIRVLWQQPRPQPEVATTAVPTAIVGDVVS
jgi:hypothetical protein